MLSDISQSERLWLSRFFSGRNSLRWQSIIDATAPQLWLSAVAPWLEFATGPSLCQPLVLPCLEGENIATWYAMAPNEQVAAQMLDEVRAFVGPSYSQFNGQWSPLVEGDEIENTLRARFGNWILRLIPCSPEDQAHLAKSISTYQVVLARRPPIVDRTVRPFARIRGDFDRALLAGNPLTSQSYLDELIATGRVTAEQRKCLEIRLLAGLGRWEELAKDRALLESVMNLALPPQTIVDTVEALYETHIAPIENDDNAGAVIHRFGQLVAQPYAPLFRERKGIRRPRVLKSFFLYEAAQPSPNEQRCDSIVDAFPESHPSRDLVLRWRHSLTFPRTSAGNREKVRQAILDEDYEVTAAISFSELPQPWAYAALLRAAVEIPSTELRRSVLEAFDKADPTVIQALTDRDRKRLDQVTSALQANVASKAHDEDWIAWAQWVASGAADESNPIAVLESAGRNWNPEVFEQDSRRCVLLAQTIGNATGFAETVFREAFPILVEFFIDRPTRSCRAFAPIYSVLISLIALNGSASGDELEIATNVTRALLEVGPSTESYADCLNDLTEVLAANSAPVHLDWALSVAEILSLYPCPDLELRMRVFVSVVQLCRVNRHRLTRPQSGVLELLASDYGCAELVAGVAPTQPSEVPKTEKAFLGVIGIYTLDEGAGERARKTLKSLLPLARVEVNSDLVATDRLRNLARTADLFAFAWRSSKHQAYYCVKDARKDREMLMPSGSGTASLVRTVIEGVNSSLT